jgi:hypothetical protein
LYQKTIKKSSKTKTVLFKTIPYFNTRNVTLLAGQELKSELESVYTCLNFDALPIDILYIQDASLFNLSEYFKKLNLHNDSIIIIDAIYQSASHLSLWQELCKSHYIQVSIDFFYCGVLFVRKEQAKEHFTIRI